MKILVAEDENDLREVLGAFLSHTGYEVDLAANGLEALDLSRANAYDAIVMDIMMPLMDGIEALIKMRGEGNTCPILLLTAKSEVRDRIRGLDAGADDYLTKPFAMGELTARIRSLTRRGGVYSGESLKIGPVKLNIRQNLLSCVNSITLSQAETELLALFMREYGKMLSPEEILNRVWRNESEAGMDTLKLYVLYLNGKLDSVGARLRVEEAEECFCLRGLDI